ncbi:cytochrome P450 [Shouchella shacheensis]|uniref:cytochrome P450 n=1 Tax=Shouchella shacheensis TaxID=1649580 RepID=UPI000740405C|nr:cytochrome P450 [Shouchella shacheensis]
MNSNAETPKDKGLDHTLALLSEGFQFIPNRRKELGSDVFQTRLLGQKVICMSGKEAAEVFYDEERFIRKGAAPPRIKKSLFGKGGVQGLDDADHKHRKLMFLSLMTPERLDDVVNITRKNWQAKIPEWEEAEQLVLFDEAEEVMCKTACEWAGVPLEGNEVNQRAKEFGEMVDAFGAVGQRYQRGKKARERSEKWIEAFIEQIRAKKERPAENTAAYVIAWHRDRKGKLLDRHTAAVELINILRPIVAIGRYITFGALALHDYPEVRQKLEKEEEGYSKMVAQEIRRFYPFGPFLGARVRTNFNWNGHEFKKGTLVLLDIYGTNRHPDLWEKPDEFRPERFKDWKGSPFAFIPQGGGDHYMGHRCAGEWVTVMLMQESLEFLANQVTYDVPEQDLSYRLGRMPSIPKSRLVIANVRRAHEPSQTT